MLCELEAYTKIHAAIEIQPIAAAAWGCPVAIHASIVDIDRKIDLEPAEPCASELRVPC